MLFIQGTSIPAPPQGRRTPAASTVSNSLQALFSTRICGATVGLMAGMEDPRKGTRHLSKGVAAEPKHPNHDRTIRASAVPALEPRRHGTHTEPGRL